MANLYFCLIGESSPVENPQAIAQNIRTAANYAGFNAVNLTTDISGTVGFERVKALIKEGVYIINDTFLVHLFPGGFPYPYIQISRELEWASAIPGPNCIGVFTQSMLESPQGIPHLISTLLRREIALEIAPFTYHLVSDYQPRDAETIGRFGLAAASWAKITVMDPNYTFDFAYDNKLPCVADLFETCDNMAPENALCLFTNRDICLVPEAIGVIRAWMRNTGSAMGFNRRIDVRRIEILGHNHLCNQTPYQGIDTFFWAKGALPEFTTHHKKLLLGREGWDVAFMLLFGGMKNLMPFNISYHISHASEWQYDENAQAGNKENRAALSEIDMPKVGLHNQKYPFYETI